MKREPLIVIGPDASAYKGGIAQFTSRLVESIATRQPVDHIGWYSLYPRFGPDRTLPEYARDGRAATADKVERLLGCTSPGSWRKAAQVIADRKPLAVVYTWIHPIHAPAIRSLAAHVAKKHSCPQLALCHNVQPHERVVFSRAAVRFALGRLDALVVHSLPELERAAELSLPTAHHIPLPVFDQLRPSVPRREQQKGRRRLLFFGAIRPYKGLDLLLRAMPALLYEVPDLRLHIAGERMSTRGENPLQLIDALGLRSQVTVDERYIPDNELTRLLHESDLAVLPFRSVTQSASVLLSLACGVPVVSTRLPAIEESVQEGVSGCLAEPDSVQSLHDAVLRALDLPFVIDQNGLLRTHGWDHYADRLLTLCRGASCRGMES